MKPEERPAEAERIGGEVSEILAAIRSPEPETDWRKGISKNAWALLALCSILIMACGVLLGQVSDADGRERAKILETLDDQREWNVWMAGRVSSVETGLARYGDDLGRVLKIVEEQRRDELTALRATAVARYGEDTPPVRRIDSKLRALAGSKAGGH